MKRLNIERKGGWDGGLREHEVGKLVIKPIGNRIKQSQSVCLEQGREILNQILEVNNSIDIIARELARQSRTKQSFWNLILSLWRKR